jgi:putative ABC transport system permease protein
MSETVSRGRDAARQADATAAAEAGAAPGRRLPVRWVAAGLVVTVVYGLAVAWSAGAFSSGTPSGNGGLPAPETQPVTRQALSSQTPVNATLGYAGSYTVLGHGGTLTSLPSPGQVISQGQAVYETGNGAPVVLLYGSVPAWRTLDLGVSGADVSQLNHDLAVLGDASAAQLGSAGWAAYSPAAQAGVRKLGLARSSQAELLAEINQLGTNLLTVTTGQSLTGGPAELPQAAPGMIRQLPGVTAVQYTGAVAGVNAYRSPYVPSVNTSALTVAASSLGLPAAAGTSVAEGSYLNAATAREPCAVLGAAAAQRLGYDRVWPGTRIWAGTMWFYVTGILSPAVLAPQIDSSVLIGFPAAGHYLHFDGHPSNIYVRTQNTPAATNAVDALLGAQADPEDPAQASVSQPSSALTAQADTADAFDTLFLGLGAVALLVGAVGVANIMVISVLERRQEIGLRRALGATRGQIRIQFLSEAITLALAGAAAGVTLGAISTAAYAHIKGWVIVIPPEAWAGGLAAALLIGAAAGLLPAIRAARLSPTQALWTL